MDLREAIAFAAEGKVHTVYTEDKLENINDIFDRMRKGAIEGRVVMRLS
jgi:propanol-preferring alcohol dehydrogenase